MRKFVRFLSYRYFSATTTTMFLRASSRGFRLQTVQEFPYFMWIFMEKSLSNYTLTWALLHWKLFGQRTKALSGRWNSTSARNWIRSGKRTRKKRKAISYCLFFYLFFFAGGGVDIIRLLFLLILPVYYCCLFVDVMVEDLEMLFIWFWTCISWLCWEFGGC